MTSQKCPKCFSSRVRRGYRPTPFWSKILFRYNLLCDNCNWEFKGFAIPGTVSAKPTKKPKKNPAHKTTDSLVDAGSDNEITNLKRESANLENNSVNLPSDATESAITLDNFAGPGVKARKKGQR